MDNEMIYYSLERGAPEMKVLELAKNDLILERVWRVQCNIL
jgi:hypothetical protein